MSWVKLTTVVNTFFGEFSGNQAVIRAERAEDYAKQALAAMQAESPLVLEDGGKIQILMPELLRQSVVTLEAIPCEQPDPLAMAGGLVIG